MEAIENNKCIASYPKVRENLNILNKILEGDIHPILANTNVDIMIGRKLANSSFFEYKIDIFII